MPEHPSAVGLERVACFEGMTDSPDGQREKVFVLPQALFLVLVGFASEKSSL
ncbi:MAG: hypothetical protein F6J98_15485 [Moorea sp. SIO4G2]|nr:hypothetical protein [Moorena sp. SIO4G2]